MIRTIRTQRQKQHQTVGSHTDAAGIMHLARPRNLNAAASQHRRTVHVCASTNPVRQALGSVVSTIYKASASMQPATATSGLSPLWSAIKRLDLNGVKSAATIGANLDERNANGDTPLLFIAREGHYKYQPAEIPTVLVQAGANKEAKDKNGLTALQISLLSGWQNIAELLIKSGADTSGVASIKSRLTCPDCKALVAKYQL